MQARRKPGPVGTYVPFDAALAPSWGLTFHEGEWWYDDGMSRFTVFPDRIVQLDGDGEYCGDMHPDHFTRNFEIVAP